jgi:hypothetical protein
MGVYFNESPGDVVAQAGILARANHSMGVLKEAFRNVGHAERRVEAAQRYVDFSGLTEKELEQWSPENLQKRISECGGCSLGLLRRAVGFYREKCVDGLMVWAGLSREKAHSEFDRAISRDVALRPGNRLEF